MHHGLAAVHDDPFAVFLALGAGLDEAGLAHGIAHAGGQGLGLTVGAAGSDDDALKQRREMFGVEDLDVLRLDVLQSIDDGALELGDVFLGGGFRLGGSGHQGVFNKKMGAI